VRGQEARPKSPSLQDWGQDTIDNDRDPLLVTLFTIYTHEKMRILHTTFLYVAFYLLFETETSKNIVSTCPIVQCPFVVPAPAKTGKTIGKPSSGTCTMAPDRNSPCPCGSGSKFKKCCATKMVLGKIVKVKAGAIEEGPALEARKKAAWEMMAEFERLGDNPDPEEFRVHMAKLKPFLGEMQNFITATQDALAPGFEGIGKIKNAEAKLFVMGSRKLMEQICEGKRQDNYPFFNSLTPHHRVELISDVAVGLIDYFSNLPANDLEHHAAWYAVWDHIASEIAIEIETERCMESEQVDDSESLSSMFEKSQKPDPSSLKLECLKKRADAMMLNQKLSVAQRRKVTKQLEKKLKEDVKLEERGVLDITGSASLGVSDIDLNRIIESVAKVLPKKYTELKELSRDISRQMMLDLDVDDDHGDDETHATWWRAHYCAFVNDLHHGHPNFFSLKPNLKDEAPFLKALQQMTSTNFKPVKEFWELNPHNFKLRDMEDESMLQDPGKRKFYRTLMDAIRQSSERHEKNWTLARTLRAYAKVLVMDVTKWRNDPKSTFKPPTKEMIERMVDVTNAAMAAVARGDENMDAAMASVADHENHADLVWGVLTGTPFSVMKAASDPYTSQQIRCAQYKIKTMVRDIWIAEWLDRMRAPHAPNVKRSFDLVSHRLTALREIPDDVLVRTPAWWTPALPDFHTEFGPAPEMREDGSGLAPWDWRKADENNAKASTAKSCWNCEKLAEDQQQAKAMKCCTGCYVACYCGKECQKEHYKVHKKICLSLKAKSGKEDKIEEEKNDVADSLFTPEMMEEMPAAMRAALSASRR